MAARYDDDDDDVDNDRDYGDDDDDDGSELTRGEERVAGAYGRVEKAICWL